MPAKPSPAPAPPSGSRRLRSTPSRNLLNANVSGVQAHNCVRASLGAVKGQKQLALSEEQGTGRGHGIQAAAPRSSRCVRSGGGEHATCAEHDWAAHIGVEDRPHGCRRRYTACWSVQSLRLSNMQPGRQGGRRAKRGTARAAFGPVVHNRTSEPSHLLPARCLRRLPHPCTAHCEQSGGAGARDAALSGGAVTANADPRAGLLCRRGRLARASGKPARGGAVRGAAHCRRDAHHPAAHRGAGPRRPRRILPLGAGALLRRYHPGLYAAATRPHAGSNPLSLLCPATNRPLSRSI